MPGLFIMVKILLRIEVSVMADSIDIDKFTGMNDVSGGNILLKRGVAQPSVIINADVDLNGRIVKRTGKILRTTLAGCHSLFGGNSCRLAVAGSQLYKIENDVAISLGSISGPQSPMSYAEVDDLIYISNPYWNGVYNHVTDSLSSWGVALPPGPVLLATTGNMPAGVYNVCMTNVTNGELSGNGPINTITLDTVGGISILNRPTGAIVWCTDCNEGVFYRIGSVDAIHDISTIEPLPSLFCSPPPFMTNLCYAFGLIWGSVGNIVYYSQPFKLSWFRLNMNRFTFETDVTMIAQVPTGLFVGAIERTVFLAGTEPAKMTQSFAGTGAIRGTLAYCNNVPALNDVLQTSEKGHQDVPIWRSRDGIVIGNAAGKLYNLSKNKLMMDSPSSGASLYRNVDETFQFLTSSSRGLSGSSEGSLNADTLTLFEDGHVSKHEFTHKGMGTTASFSDSAVCEVRRGGVLI